MTVIYNNDTNTISEVIAVLMKATGCDLQEASVEVWEAEHLGKSSVHFSDKDTCTDVAKIISEIGVRTTVEPEWLS